MSNESLAKWAEQKVTEMTETVEYYISEGIETEKALDMVLSQSTLSVTLKEKVIANVK